MNAVAHGANDSEVVIGSMMPYAAGANRQIPAVCRTIVTTEKNRFKSGSLPTSLLIPPKKPGMTRAESSQGHGRASAARRAMRTSEQHISVH